jgi:Rrf2 family protein
MKFSSQEEYGLRCLLNIALHERGVGSRNIQEISKDEGLSASNVGKLMRLLRLGGFLASVRGVEGGYSLARPANQILISDVLNTLGGKLYEPDFCEKFPGLEDTCTHSSACSIKPLWSKIQSAIDNVLNEMTIEDLLEQSQQGSATPTQLVSITDPRLVVLNNE